MKALGLAGAVLIVGGFLLGATDTSLVGGIILVLLGFVLSAIAVVVTKIRTLWRSGLQIYDVVKGGRPSAVVVKRVELPRPFSVITGPAIDLDLLVTNATGTHAISREVPVPRLFALGLLPNAAVARVVPALDVRKLIARDATEAASASDR